VLWIVRQTPKVKSAMASYVKEADVVR